MEAPYLTSSLPKEGDVTGPSLLAKRIHLKCIPIYYRDIFSWDFGSQTFPRITG